MEPFDLPAHHNPLLTRDDVRLWADQLLAPLADHYLPGSTGLHLGNASAHYSSRTAAFEGWSRMLWGLAPLLAGGGSYPEIGRHLDGLRTALTPTTRVIGASRKARTSAASKWPP